MQSFQKGKTMQKFPNVLTIAGSDSGGGAGIQADLKTFAILGTYGTSVITALTAQSGLGVSGIHAPPADFVALQLKTVLENFPIKAAKTGMLFSSEIIDYIAQELKNKDFPLVVDPVCVSTTGHVLIEKDAIENMKKKLIPLADLITPNIPEAEVLTGIKIEQEGDFQKAANVLLDLGAKAVLIKGGHNAQNSILITDWFYEKNSEPSALKQAHIQTENTHGTGCTLSAAICANLAKKLPLKPAISNAQEFINKALKHSYAPGNGSGPVNHLANL